MVAGPGHGPGPGRDLVPCRRCYERYTVHLHTSEQKAGTGSVDLLRRFLPFCLPLVWTWTHLLLPVSFLPFHITSSLAHLDHLHKHARFWLPSWLHCFHCPWSRGTFEPSSSVSYLLGSQLLTRPFLFHRLVSHAHILIHLHYTPHSPHFASPHPSPLPTTLKPRRTFLLLPHS